LTSPEESSFWHSAPLAFAILPAVGGLLFQNGGAVVTDILLLGFGSMFLNWCVRAPWDWYHTAQQIQYVEENEEEPFGDTILEEDEEESESTHADDHIPSSEPTAAETQSKENKSNAQRQTNAQKDAARELAREEIMALIACFIGPILGAYILHAIRSQLTRPAEGLVSNYNLTIFIMAAELRPISHVIKLKQARMVHLQRIVRTDANSRLGNVDAQEISKRLGDVETRLAEQSPGSDFDTMKISATVRQSLQPQLDALNRAVRRYEKRQAAQSIQIEARFGELEGRLNDALALAAAAARTGQRPGIISIAFTWVVSALTYIAELAWTVFTYPFRVITSMVNELTSWFTKGGRQPRKRVTGQGNGHSTISTPRMQSRSGR
jgi:hypothetical protein